MRRAARQESAPADLPGWVVSPVVELDPDAPRSWRMWQAYRCWSGYAHRLRAEFGGRAQAIMEAYGTTLDGFLRLARELPLDRQQG